MTESIPTTLKRLGYFYSGDKGLLSSLNYSNDSGDSYDVYVGKWKHCDGSEGYDTTSLLKHYNTSLLKHYNKSNHKKLELSEIRELASQAGFVVKHCPSFNSTIFEATNKPYGGWSIRIDKELLTLVRLIEDRLSNV